MKKLKWDLFVNGYVNKWIKFFICLILINAMETGKIGIILRHHDVYYLYWINNEYAKEVREKSKFIVLLVF